ncbi:MAG: hypothetical protein ACRCSM_06420 [Sediminibacterium sp.]|jgi:hypothetical protein|nr:hypothetical protein [Chitinophagaceae bacterium]MCA6446594.1 hypothetical protein [Chitinophagaceae bacterium]
MDNKILFAERQRFKQIWLWLILLGVNGLFIFGLIKQVIFGYQFGDKPMSNVALIIVTILTFVLSFLFLNFRLDTNIKSDGIYVRLFPFQWTFKYYPWDKINQSFVTQYNAIGEFGGWGLRGLGKNKAFNISGDKGIQIVTQDGSKILIGTNKADEAMEVLKQLGHLTTT